MSTQLTLLLLGLLCLAAAAPATPPQYIAAREVILEARPADGAAVDDVLVWVSTDTGRTWQPADVTRAGRHTVRYTAPADGRYDFYLVLRNAAGVSAAPPQPGSRASATIIVDTLPPLLQAHAVEVERSADCPLRVALKITLVEENLAPSGPRVFCRGADHRWTDGGPATLTNEWAVACLPPTDESTLDLRLVAVDLAGNVASVELPGVKLPRAPQDAAPVPLATQPAPLQPSAPAAQPSAPIPDEAQRLRRMAGEFLAQGRFPLAVARLEDALVLAPTDPDLLTELGTALYRAGRYDDANRRFQAALANAPQHPAALDGLALVAVTQRQYSQAREYLEQLQRLRPNSGLLWLRSGDVEHRLGNTARALAAWRKALNAEDGDPDAQASARRRLEYFGSLSAAETQPASSQPWHEPRPSRPSSSSMAMTSTKKPSR